MDPLTHTLSGIVLGNLIAPDPQRLAYTTTLVIAANLPDIDFLTRPLKTLGSPKYYHNLTHSICGVLALSVVAGILAHIVYPFLGTLQLLGLCLLGCSLHVLLDTAITSCYVRLLWPFSNRQFSMGLLVGLNFRTASRKCGRPQYVRCILCQLRGSLFNPILILLMSGTVLALLWPSHRRLVSLLICQCTLLCLVVLYIWKRQLRRYILKSHPEINHSSLYLYPSDIIPCRWLAIEETGTQYRLFSVRGIPPRIRSNGTLPRPEKCSHQAVLLSTGNSLYHMYRARMAHPYVECKEHHGIINVTWKDLRYLQSQSADLYAIKLAYSTDLELVSQEFRECWK